MIHFVVVSSLSPQGPRAWILSVLMPISAPRPSWPPSLKRVLALTITAELSTAATKRWADAQIGGDDRVGVAGAVAGDVGDGVVQESTTATASILSRYSVSQSAGVARPSWPGRVVWPRRHREARLPLEKAPRRPWEETAGAIA